MDAEAKELLRELKVQFGVRKDDAALLQGGDGSVARVGALHFRLRHRRLEVWSGRAWMEARTLRELGYVLADAGGLTVPPGVD